MRPYKASIISGQLQPPPAPIIVEEEEEFEVNDIIDKRKRGSKIEYLVSWKGYGPEEDSWEPAENLGNAQDVVDRFNIKYPRAETKYKRTRRVR